MNDFNFHETSITELESSQRRERSWELRTQSCPIKGDLLNQERTQSSDVPEMQIYHYFNYLSCYFLIFTNFPVRGISHSASPHLRWAYPIHSHYDSRGLDLLRWGNWASEIRGGLRGPTWKWPIFFNSYEILLGDAYHMDTLNYQAVLFHIWEEKKNFDSYGRSSVGRQDTGVLLQISY